ncbi:MAG: CARDB domain-containing protein, partial [Cyanobacteria bacterium P01_F01_bin.42]
LSRGRNDYRFGDAPASAPSGVGLYQETEEGSELIAVFGGYEANDASFARLEKQVLGRTADLTIEFGNQQSAPGTVPDSGGLVTVNVTNIGQRAVDGIAIDLFASADGELDPINRNEAASNAELQGIDEFLGQIENISLEGGESQSFQLDFSSDQFQNPSIVSPGSYRLIAQVDGQGEISESNENNNQAVQTLAAPGTDVILAWNSVFLNAVQAEGKAEQDLEFDMQANSLDAIPGVAPPVQARMGALLHTAIFDVVNALSDSEYESYLPDIPNAPRGASVEAAVVGAAYQVLAELFPEQTEMLNQERNRSLRGIDDNLRAKARGIAFGEQVADQLLELRADDGSNVAQAPYDPKLGFGKYEERDENGLVTALLPKWGEVKPFVVEDIDEFLPEGPPEYGSDEYATQLLEVQTLGGLENTDQTTLTRTDDQTEIARFWSYDRAETTRPPGQWNEIAQGVARQEGNTLMENARLFALLNLAMADGGIAAWDAKYEFEQLRPVNAIRGADDDTSDKTSSDLGWQPLLGTPNFPDYVSGHATFGGAAAGILENFFGDVEFVATSQELPGVTRAFSGDGEMSSFDQAALENADSRIYGGIHIDSSNLEGLAIGNEIADVIFNSVFQEVLPA